MFTQQLNVKELKDEIFANDDEHRLTPLWHFCILALFRDVATNLLT